MARLTSELVLSLTDRVSGPAQGLHRTVASLQDRLARNNVQLDAMRGRMVGAVAATAALAAGVGAPVRAAMDFESAMADIRKVVDFETPQAFTQMGLDIREMSKEMPMAASEIAAIVAAAGQSGLAVSELLPFAEMAAKVGVAWEVSADVAGEALAKLQAAMGTTVSQTGLVADAINHLGNNTAASAPDILDMVKRVAASGEQFGFQAKEAAAFGAAMIGAGFESEVAATSFLNMGRALTRGASATTRQREALQVLGLEATDVAKRMQKDAVGTVQDVLRRLQDVPDYMRASVISDFFGDEARALAPLITNYPKLAEALGYVGSETEYAGSAAKEYADRIDTAAGRLQAFRNRVTDLAISIGDALLPTMNRLMEVFGPIISSFSNLARRFPGLTAAIVGTAGALAAFRVAAIAAQFSILWLRGAKIMLAIAGLKGLGAAASFAALAFTPFTAALRGARSAVVGFTAATAIAGSGGALRIMAGSLLGLLNPIRLVTNAMRVLRLAFIGTGIGAALLAIGAAGAWIYNNWSGIGVAFEAFKGAFLRGIEPIMPALEPLIGGVASLVEWVRSLVGPLDETNGTWAAWGTAAGKAVADVVLAVAALPGRIVEYVSDMKGRLIAFDWSGAAAGLIAQYVSIPMRIATIPAEILRLFTGIDLATPARQMIATFVETAKSALNEMGGRLLAFDWGGAAAGLIAQYVSIPSRIATIPAEILQLFTGIDLAAPAREMIATFVETAKSALNEMGGWVKGKLREMFSFNISMPSWLGGGSAVAQTTSAIDQRARGGSVISGRTYLVGEEGPELITPDRGGWVHTADETRGMLGGDGTSQSNRAARSGAAQSGAPVTINLGGITVNGSPGMNEEALSRVMIQKLDDHLRDVFSGGHWNGGYRVA